ncbi:MAG: S1/P1 nuclease [Pseudomonadota bacterium]|jgi:hypothetical protein|nr:S1/P1 nuclease [Pseudomonadota bacterium]MEC7996428.1 S1/P1 nuclease [Pseudomonadota bacterium]MEC8471189.1 S1/P1 nuclease [Pseudomonadota bacterium]MEC8701481.1 S1/P1 nuclease [Pseudomonadota bacterium]MEC9085821.1 S1/P1 nuclease [Pseudomonadota bacterium]
MTQQLTRSLCIRLFSTLLLIPISWGASAFAWDSVGHRLSAAVALEFMEPDTAAKLITILRAHPRYQRDFIDQIPGDIDRDNEKQMTQWLLGQAASWPDIARGLPDGERARYNRSSWHYTDGAWIRDSAPFQGNIYLGIEAFADVDGMDRREVDSEEKVSNVVTGIDYNAAMLSNVSAPTPARAIALCWVLHLIGDIHQPLHTGSLYTASLFETGDRGGNAIRIDDSNLHSRWDRALTESGVSQELPILISRVTGFSTPKIQGIESDWTAWMNESRSILQTSVYDGDLREAILDAESSNTDLPSQKLDDAYVALMQNISRQRLGLAGLRLAIFFENELP